MYTKHIYSLDRLWNFCTDHLSFAFKGGYSLHSQFLELVRIYRVWTSEWNTYYCHVVPMGCCPRAIFIWHFHGLYLKFVCRKFDITKKNGHFAGFLFHYLTVCFRVFVDLRHIYVIYVWIRLDVKNIYMWLTFKSMVSWRRYCSLKTANICLFKKSVYIFSHFMSCCSQLY